MHWPQVVWICLVSINLLVHLTKDGEPRTDKYSLAESMLNACIMGWLLWAGGFFG